MQNIQKFVDSDSIILGLVDVLNFDHDCGLLYSALAKLKKDYYSPNEKIVVLHNDIEYFYQGHSLGFTTYNLFSCWRDLNIPYSAMVMLTNYSNMELAIEHFIVDDRDRPTIIPTIVNDKTYSQLADPIPLMSRSSLLEHIDLTKSISYPAMCLLGTAKSHRVKLLQYITKHNLFENIKTNFSSPVYSKIQDEIIPPHGIVPTLNIETLNSMIEKLSTDDCGPSNALYTYPHRFNDSCFSQSRLPEIVELSQISVMSRSDPCLLGKVEDFYHNFFLDVVAETVFDYPHVYISEKTLKPLLLKTPFILFGPSNTLSYLRQHGFKTFGDFWDESYDEESDPQLRFLKCCSIMHNIASTPLEKLQLLYDNMTPILIHNQNTLLDYIRTQYLPLYGKINL